MTNSEPGVWCMAVVGALIADGWTLLVEQHGGVPFGKSGDIATLSRAGRRVYVVRRIAGAEVMGRVGVRQIPLASSGRGVKAAMNRIATYMDCA